MNGEVKKVGIKLQKKKKSKIRNLAAAPPPRNIRIFLEFIS